MFFATSPGALFIPPAAIDPVGLGKVAVMTGRGSGVGLARGHGRLQFHGVDLTRPGAGNDGIYAAIASFRRHGQQERGLALRKKGIRCDAMLPGCVDSQIGKAIAAEHGHEYDAGPTRRYSLFMFCMCRQPNWR
ncbi:hypothetical protein LZ31DRAFT_596564 [Colletotrichum somersetense]|nr:hypothetical protein LZ31DRAFT_596564 [Colletotrichum somersetense]